MIRMSDIRGQRSVLFFLACMSILSASGGSIYGEEPPTITVSKGDRINLTVSPLTGGEGAAATKTLQNVSSGENPVWGADSRHIMFTDGGVLYLFDTVNAHRGKILDDLGRITEPSWSR